MKKKSFILYNDFQSTLDKLSDEQAGKLLKTIYAYVNDTPFESDMIIDLVFEPIKTQLKRDEEKYQRIVSRNKINGEKGGRPKKNPKNPVGNLVTQNNPEKPKKADSDSVNGIESVKDNVKDLKHYVSLWNEKANKFGLSKIISLNESRKTKLRTRLKEPNFDFEQIIDKIQIDTPFLISGDWKVDFDFIIKNDNNYIKILEGKYKRDVSNKTKMRNYDE